MATEPMTSRERVRRCLELDRPDRVPRDVWLLPATTMRYGKQAVQDFLARWPRDLTQVNAGKPKSRRASGDAYAAGRSTDEWGCVFENIQPGVHGEIKHPILDDWSKLDDVVQPPWELLEIDVEAANAFCRQSDQFVLSAGWARLFERMQFLRGTENLYLDMALNPSEVLALRDKVHAFNVRLLETWAPVESDAMCIMDDWGAQRALLIHPDQWRAIFKPCYADYCRIARDAGKKVFMHSDGYIIDIYEDLIEIGVDAINSQLFCMDLAEIGRRFRGRITFWGEIDRQHILPRGTPADARAAVAAVVEHLWQPEGGCIAQCELGSGAQLENGDAVYQAWLDLT